MGELPKEFAAAWGQLDEYFASDTVRIIRDLHEDPGPVCAALGRFPQTLVHGDWKNSNLALVSRRPAKTLAIDWQFATRAAPAVDLARYLSSPWIVQPVPREDSIRYYRKRFELHAGAPIDDEDWQAQVEIALLAGVLWAGWALMLDAAQDPRKRAELPWWERQVRARRCPALARF